MFRRSDLAGTSGQRERKGRLLCSSNGWVAGRFLREAASEKSGSVGPMARGVAPGTLRWSLPGRRDLGEETRSNLAGVSGSALFFLSLLPALGKRRSGTRLLPAASFAQLDTLFRLMVF